MSKRERERKRRKERKQYPKGKQGRKSGIKKEHNGA
jgi:hypothetical protein